MTTLRDKVGVVVGGATGIGAATAIRLGSEGMNVVVADINLGAAEGTAHEIAKAGGSAIAVAVDVTDEAKVASLFQRCEAEHGRVHAVHANAANLGLIAKDGSAMTLSYDIFRQTMEINLFGYLLCTRYAVPALLRAGGGAIVYTSSSAAFGGAGPLLAYGMSKAGIGNLVRNVATEWGTQGIRANAVAPGFVLTENAMANVAQEVQDGALAASHCGFHGRPEDVAGVVAFLMSDDARWIQGQVLSVDGGLVMR